MIDKDAKIYVAGHRGLVGSAILRKLEREGYRNIVLRTHGELDLERQDEVEGFFSMERPEYVFLAAAKVGGILANSHYPADFIYRNLAIELNVIHCSYIYGVRKLLFLGSSCVYPRECPQPMKEGYLLSGYLERTNEPYAVAKIAGIKMCEAYNRQYGTKFIVAMPTNLYGPNDNFDLETSHVLPALMRRFHLAKLASEGRFEEIIEDFKRHDRERVNLSSKITPSIVVDRLSRFGIKIHDLSSSQLMPSPSKVSVEVWGTGSPLREFLHVDDLADACLFLMNNYEGFEIVNVGTGREVKVRELAHMVSRIIGFKGNIIFDSSKPDGTPRKLLDSSKLNALGWRPRWDLEEGIEMTYKWYIDKFE